VAEYTDDERKHLEFVQAVVNRLSGSSALVKAWALTLGIASYGVARLTLIPELTLIGIAAVVLLALLDARYLVLERRFRALYDRIRAQQIDLYDMSIRAADAALGPVLRSWSVLGFYGVVAAVGVVAFISSLAR
jgi:histidine triad (HIT) family protein